MGSLRVVERLSTGAVAAGAFKRHCLHFLICVVFGEVMPMLFVLKQVQWRVKNAAGGNKAHNQA